MNRASASLDPSRSPALLRGNFLQRKCACGQHSGGGECEACKKKKQVLQRKEARNANPTEIPASVHKVLQSTGRPLDPAIREVMEPRFGHDFSQVRIHRDAMAERSAREVGALAYTTGNDLVFDERSYAPGTDAGRKLIAHELAHVVQQRASSSSLSAGISASDSPAERNADLLADAALAGWPLPSATSGRGIQRRAAPFIKKVTVHLTPPQTADLEWEGSAPATAPGSDHFTVSTGKGYSNPGDPPGTCRRSCCSDPQTQCAPPWNQPTQVGACCTYYGNNFWTGTPLEEHNGCNWWTPIQPYYSIRGIALHQYPEVTGQPIGHGCVRMDEDNAKRIYDFSNGRRTNVTIDGRAAPVACEESRRCHPSAPGSTGQRLETPEAGSDESRMASIQEQAVPGLEGELS